MKRNSGTKRQFILSVCAGIALTVLAACGGGTGDGGDTAAAPTERAVPTMPAAQFAAPTTMIRAGGDNTLTDTETMTETAEIATPEPDAADVDLTLGETIYANRNCAECHGVEGEGVEGQGSAIAGTTMTEDAFSDLMRTGGEIGPDHLYGPNAISPGGMTALHAWLQSLSSAE